jgi:gliding motility-associated-like protein
MSKFKIILVIIFGMFSFSGNIGNNFSERTLGKMMDPIEYIICDDDGFIELNILDIQTEVLAGFGGTPIGESIVIGTSTGRVIKLNNLSGAITTELICDLPGSLSDIAVDENGEFYGCNFGSIFYINQTDCSRVTILNPSSVSLINSLSFDTQGNLYYGSGGSSSVYRYDSDELSPPYVWHDFGSGSPSGDFVMLNGKMYISWAISNNFFLYEVTIDANFNYVSHINLGTIIDDTYGLASELGELYGVATGELYRIDLDTFTFTTVATNDFTYGDWWGAAGLHEASNFEASTYTSLSDANANINPLPDLWTNTQQGGQTIYVRVENTITGIFEIVEVELIIYDNLPDLTTPSNLTICENENNGIFDLTTVETELLQNVFHAVTVTYHVSDEDATNNVSPLATNYPATSNQETIYVRVQNVDNECFSIAQFDVLTNPIPEIIIPNDLVQCEDQSNGIFTLTDVETELLQDNTVAVTVSYHTNMSDADTGMNAIATSYQITPGQETIFVRIENNANGCFTTTQFEIILNENLQISTPNDISQCVNENNGIFDLTQVESEILQNVTQNVVVTYHANANDADTNSNALNTNYTASTNQDTIFVRVQSTVNDCFAITQFDVISAEGINATTPSNLILCEGTNNGLFDLTQIEAELLQNVTQAVTVSYHISFENATTNTNSIDPNYTLTSGQATIYVRIENASNTVCFETTEFAVQILENPIVEPFVNTPSSRLLTDCYIDSNNDGFFDLNDIYDEIITSGNTNYVLEFYLSENDATQEINSIDPIYYTENAEELFVTITNDNGCKSITNFFVNPECYDTVVDISNIYFPEFFTPNNDLTNDTWNVRGISVAVSQTAIMYIFDRYGKLLYYFRPGQTVGWDGTYRGKQLPSSDYWYKMEISKGQTFLGSFSLIRR